jgi:hypothetical protein
MLGDFFVGFGGLACSAWRLVALCRWPPHPKTALMMMAPTTSAPVPPFGGGGGGDSRLLLSSGDGDPAAALIKLLEFLFHMVPSS